LTRDLAIRLVVWGRVQGVGYRWWTIGEARRLGLRGWVRNRRDGAVEILAVGPPDALAVLAEACEQGPPGAHVTALERVPAEDEGGLGFTERPTI